MKFIVFAGCILLGYSNFVWGQQSRYGVNLAGLEFAKGTYPGALGVNYFLPNASEINYFSSKGLKLIRLPFSWERVQPTLGGPLNATYLGYINSVVLAAATANVSIILDVHNYARYPLNSSGAGPIINTTGGPTIAQFGNLWKQLAQYFANQTAVWGYDLMNEPHNLGTSVSGGTNYWQPIAQAAIDSIRKVDTKHVIIIEGPEWSGGKNWVANNSIPGNNLAALVDPQKKLVFEAHMYFDSNESGTYGSCCGTSSLFSVYPNNVNAGVTNITSFVNWLKTNSLTGYVGEYGVPNSNVVSGSELTNWNTLLDNFLAYLQANCVLGTVWAGGPNWGSYRMSVEPSGGTDASAMPILSKYTSFPSSCTGISTSLSYQQVILYAQPKANTVQLNWQDTDIPSIAYFDIEKSDDGSNWSNVSRVESSRSTDNSSNYSFDDLSISESNVSKWYYRLKISKADYSSSFSNIAIAERNSSPFLHIYPNPFSESTSLYSVDSPSESINFVIRDLFGNEIDAQYNVISSTLPLKIGTKLQPGSYTIQVSTSKDVSNSKLVKY